MNKTAQNLTWNCLPLEVKKEVQRQYQIATNAKEHFTECTLEYLFGVDNLTSEVEGEEVLTISRKEVQEQYRMYRNMGMIKRLDALMQLFGSKCLPDEVAVAENANCSEPKPAEPKFKYNVGDKVRYKEFVGTVYQIEETDYVIRNLAGGDLIGWLKESDLEPYTETTESNCTKESDGSQPVTICNGLQAGRQAQSAESHCKSEPSVCKLNNSANEPANEPASEPTESNCTNKSNDPQPATECSNFYESSETFTDHCKSQRLKIAAMAMQGILSNPYSFTLNGKTQDKTPENVADVAFLYTDAFLTKAEEKGLFDNEK